MINLKDVVSDLKGDYIHALFYFIKDDLNKRGFPDVDDLHYDNFYHDVDSAFSLKELKCYCDLFSENNDDCLLVSLCSFFERLCLYLDNSKISL